MRSSRSLARSTVRCWWWQMPSEVNTGAFDDLNGVIDRARAHPGGAWVHLDAAFGLFARLSERTRHLLDGIEGADSICADAHKWLNVPYDSGFAFVKQKELLFRAFSSPAAYLAGAPLELDMDAYVPEMSRRSRGIAIWCSIKQMGCAGIRRWSIGVWTTPGRLLDWVEAEPGLELMAPAPLNMVCWRYAPDGLDDEAANRFNKEAVVTIADDGRAFVSGTVWNGRAAIRCAFDNWTTTLADVEILESAVRDVGEKLRVGWRIGDDLDRAFSRDCCKVP